MLTGLLRLPVLWFGTFFDQFSSCKQLSVFICEGLFFQDLLYLLLFPVLFFHEKVTFFYNAKKHYKNLGKLFWECEQNFSYIFFEVYGFSVFTSDIYKMHAVSSFQFLLVCLFTVLQFSSLLSKDVSSHFWLNICTHLDACKVCVLISFHYQIIGFNIKKC